MNSPETHSAERRVRAYTDTAFGGSRKTIGGFFVPSRKDNHKLTGMLVTQVR